MHQPAAHSTVLRQGPLPGGLEGVLEHHTRYVDGPGEGVTWVPWHETVVSAEVPAAQRFFERATFGFETDVKVGRTLTLRRRDPVPVEPPAPVPFAFALPPGVRVRIEHGRLRAWTDGHVTDPARLERLCRAASTVADTLRAAAAAEPALDAVGPPADTDRRRWVRAGAARVAWPQPPADVDSAIAAYRRVVGARARRFGALAGLVLFVVASLGAGALLAVGVRTGLAVGGIFTAAFAAWVLWRIVAAAVGTARELSAAERDARAHPWGLEAFVQGYAGPRGLSVEDPRTVQRRFDAPVRGRAVAALHGPAGHLVLWLDPTGQRWVIRVGDRVRAERADWSAAALDATAVERREPATAPR